jgi:serine/threonine-protein kinase
MFAAGDRIRTFEVLAPLGAGGMGEVYRARDPQLGREVAIKVLQADRLSDEGRRRFLQEARAASALSHPHIVAVHEIGSADGIDFIVMEYVSGPTLGALIPKGGMPVREALRLAIAIADAIAAAHAKGIVHRDLKPANVIVGREGVVKVVDFGLAKALEQSDSSDTQTTATRVTATGAVLGTPPYMSPEQVRGQPLDRRADIWAFGCGLSEMVCGRWAFWGDTASDTIVAILEREPDWAALPDAARPLLPLLQRCLEKDASRRLRDIGDVRLWLDQAVTGATAPFPKTPFAPSSKRRGWLAVAALGLAAAAFGAWLLFGRAPIRSTPRPVTRFELASTAAGTFAPTARFGDDVAISPDGTRVAYTSLYNGKPQLFLRRLDQPAAILIAGAERGGQPFFSPDGRQLGFITGESIRRVPAEGGQAVVVCKASPSTRGATWGPDDTIIFAEYSEEGPRLFRVKAGGGQAQRLFAGDAVTADERYAQPWLLPGGRALLYTVFQPDGQSRVVARRLDGSGTTVVAEGGVGARYLPPGFVLFAQGDSLMAVRFDAASLGVRGAPTRVVESVFARTGDGVANVAVAADGTALYVSGRNARSLRRLVWFDRSGKRLAPAVEGVLQGARNQRLSPDGRRVAVTVGSFTHAQIWIHDLAGAAQPLKLTHRRLNTFANWSPDGRRIFLASGQRVRWLPADGSVLEPEAVADASGSPFDCSPDGAFLIFGNNAKNYVLQLATGVSRPWPGTPFNEYGADFSPDGRFVAYVSDPSGRFEVWVRPFPGPGSPVRVSADGGVDPQWSKDGKEIFYRNGRQVLAARVLSGPSGFHAEPPRVLFEGDFAHEDSAGVRYYDVAADGRFLMLEASGVSSASIILIQNWAEELERQLGSS